MDAIHKAAVANNSLQDGRRIIAEFDSLIAAAFVFARHPALRYHDRPQRSRSDVQQLRAGIKHCWRRLAHDIFARLSGLFAPGGNSVLLMAFTQKSARSVFCRRLYVRTTF